MVKGKLGRPGAASVQIVIEQLRALAFTKSELARRLGLSQDYVYRILNGRSPFPKARELLERMAALLDVDPYAFAEYRAHDEALPASTRIVWERMRERGMSRDALFQALEGRISRPYFNSILRGDQPFPQNRAFIQLFALALELPPTAFREYGPRTAPRRTVEQVAELEARTFEFFFDKMMADHGFAAHPITLGFLDEALCLGFFLPKAQLTGELITILARMGELGMGFVELEKVSGLPRERLAALFTTSRRGLAEPGDPESIRRALRID